MKVYTYKPAFTLLEVIFIIVILGIVSSIGSELIAKVYQQYIIQRALHRATIKTELAALQIANRLAAAISGTVVRRSALIGGTIEDINDNMSLDDDAYVALQWVGADMDSFSAGSTPGWSGFCDLNASIAPTISTPGSNLNITNTIIGNLAGGTLPSLSPAVYFPNDPIAYPISTPLSGNSITLASTTPTHIVEHYKLAWTSYALTLEKGNLYLHYHFPPIKKVDIRNTRSSLLMKNISTFKFKGSGRTMRFKICKEEKIGEDYNITACKEKVVF